MPASTTALPGPPEGHRLLRPAAGAALRTALRERGRRRVVRLIFVVYALAIVEGALRKWALPQASAWLYFVRDPVLLLLYGLAAQHRLWPRRSVWLAGAWVMMLGGVVLIALQFAVGGPAAERLLLAVYGWRNYFLYVPLAFLVGAVFSAADLQRLMRLSLWLCLPIALLVAWQFHAPADAPINVGSASDEAYQFPSVGLDAEHVRPTGPFSSGAGQQQFVATACALWLAAVVAPRRLRQRWGVGLPLLAASGLALLACLAFSGSRGTVLQAVLAGIFALAAGLVGRGAGLRARALLWPLALAAAALVLAPALFPEGFAALVTRWTSAEAIESRSFAGGIFGRALYGLVDFVRLVPEVPALGWGLGYGGNASITLQASIDGVVPGRLAETDFARHMVDLGPALGIAFIAWRLALAGWLVRRVLRGARRSSDPVPMLLLSYVFYVLVFGQVTGQGAINFFGWLYTGLLIAACRDAAPAVRAVGTAGPPGAPPRLR